MLLTLQPQSLHLQVLAQLSQHLHICISSLFSELNKKFLKRSFLLHSFLFLPYDFICAGVPFGGFPYNIRAVAVLLSLPARPLSCTYSSTVLGVPKCTTVLMSGQSMPILKAVVAITTRSFPLTVTNEFKIFCFISLVEALVYISTSLKWWNWAGLPYGSVKCGPISISNKRYIAPQSA